MKKHIILSVLILGSSCAFAKTIYTGDRIDGVPVITHLDVNDLAAGKKYRFMFKGSEMNIGQSWYTPVIVVKGNNSGKNLLINTGIHGDELNGAFALQKVMKSLSPDKVSGAVVGVFQASPNSLMHISRNWYMATDSGEYENMNRLFPGKQNGNTAQVQAYKLWNDLWKGNAQYVIDLHTQSTDTNYPLMVYADYRVSSAQQMAELIPADQIKKDPGEKGSVETTFIEAGIPAITVEIGKGREYQPEYVNRTVTGINNIMISLGIIKGSITQTAKTQGAFTGNDMTSVRASTGGYAEVLVSVGDNVKKDQLIAIQTNPFGDLIKEYKSPVDGKVLSTGSGATREAGGLLVRILQQNPDVKCNNGC